MVHFIQSGSCTLFYSCISGFRISPKGLPHSVICAFYRICAPQRSFSQLITTFFALQLPGIHHKPIFRLTILFISISLHPTALCILLVKLRIHLTRAFLHQFNVSTKSYIFSFSIYFKDLSWRIRGLNPWPSACKADALANWANSPFILSVIQQKRERKN